MIRTEGGWRSLCSGLLFIVVYRSLTSCIDKHWALASSRYHTIGATSCQTVIR
ncbi:hypothetical protein PGR6_20790 [Pseudomonas sp. GR 6-02]|nr:hypothetical protein PGR6_20790 [Pseudomonas sp. GR 6-02]